MKHSAVVIWLAVFSANSTATAESSREAIAFFESEVRPLLIKHCVKCHGPKKSESGLRLDAISTVLKGGESGPVLVPGRPDDSLLMTAVRHEDGMEMPPGRQLEAREIAALARWIKDGAVWPEGMMLAGTGPALRGGPITESERAFWSYQPIQNPRAPKVDASLTVRNDIDRFVHAKLSQAGLTTRSAASKRVLIRRATFDLTGLPPTVKDIDAFLADSSPDAFQKVVDRLLQTRQYGERWGRHWLDVVRYADTAGETGDYPTPLSYKYRNWVINAFNRDLPYDEFVRQQVAGDILAKQLVESFNAEPEATAGGTSKAVASGSVLNEDVLRRYRDMITATGFIAISRRFGFDVENYHHLTIQDTIDTLGQAVLGLSLGCARCHDHKYDPVNTNDYYAWYGIFESTRYSFPGSEQKKRSYDSFPDIPPQIASKRKAAFDARVANLDSDIKRIEEERKQTEVRLKSSGSWKSYVEARLLKQADKDRDGHVGLHVWRSEPLPIVGLNTSDVVLKVPGTVPPQKLVVHPNPKEGVGIGWRSSMAGRVRITGRVQDAHDCGDSITWHIDGLNSEGFKNVTGGAIDRNSAGEFAAADKPIYVDVQQGDFIQLAIMPKSHYGCDLTQVEFTVTEVNTDGEARKWDVVSDVLNDLLEANPNDDQYGNAEVWHFFQVDEDRGKAFGASPRTPLSATDIAALEDRIERSSKELARLVPERDALMKSGPYQVVYGAIEQDEPRDAQIRIRGNRNELGDAVPRKNLEILGDDPLPEASGSGRLELAKWLTRDNNTLTPRVMVNRIWQQHFGRGLVGTENDFGTRGEKPSHPELLDWLASRFVENKWSIKSMHRLIMNSAAYQQTSEFDAVAAEEDPDGRLLWRFNRRRLSAEEIRDAMLFVSGELDFEVDGGHPFPPESSWGFTQHAPYYGVYPTKKRSVYLMQQRLKRHPFLGLFDGADVNVSTARRELTTVPTQALYLMNNEFVHEQSVSFARRILEAEGDRIKFAFEETIGRQPTDTERVSVRTFVSEYLAALDDNQESEIQAWAAFSRTLLTRNEFLFID